MCVTNVGLTRRFIVEQGICVVEDCSESLGHSLTQNDFHLWPYSMIPWQTESNTSS